MRLQISDTAADAANAVLADTCKTFHGIVPILQQGWYEGKKPSLSVPATYPADDSWTQPCNLLFFNTEYSHFRTSFPLVLEKC